MLKTVKCFLKPKKGCLKIVQYRLTGISCKWSVNSPNKVFQLFFWPCIDLWKFLSFNFSAVPQDPLQLKAIVDQIGVSINFQAIDLFSKNALPHLNLQQDNSNLATLVECLAIVVYVYLHIEPGQNSIKSFLDPHVIFIANALNIFSSNHHSL